MKRSALLVVGIILVALGVLGPMLAVPVVFVLPDTFAASVKLSSAVTGPAARAAEVATIRSRPILDQVAAHLNLATAWAQKTKADGDLGPETVRDILGRGLEVKWIHDTPLIEIKIFSDSREEAAVIANQVAEVYRDSPLAGRDPAGRKKIEIVERAQPPRRPVRPNKPQLVTACLGGGIGLAFLGFILVLVSRRRLTLP